MNQDKWTELDLTVLRKLLVKTITDGMMRYKNQKQSHIGNGCIEASEYSCITFSIVWRLCVLFATAFLVFGPILVKNRGNRLTKLNLGVRSYAMRLFLQLKLFSDSFIELFGDYKRRMKLSFLLETTCVAKITERFVVKIVCCRTLFAACSWLMLSYTKNFGWDIHDGF